MHSALVPFGRLCEDIDCEISIAESKERCQHDHPALITVFHGVVECRNKQELQTGHN
uniref:Uncharacterized protein n=1 Tax=Arundo donax TaxID=35708 RepID=A0A0A9B4B1_ARUDO